MGALMLGGGRSIPQIAPATFAFLYLWKERLCGRSCCFYCPNHYATTCYILTFHPSCSLFQQNQHLLFNPRPLRPLIITLLTPAILPLSFRILLPLLLVSITADPLSFRREEISHILSRDPTPTPWEWWW